MRSYVVDYAGQSGQANYTVHQGDSWIGLMMSEQVSVKQYSLESVDTTSKTILTSFFFNLSTTSRTSCSSNGGS
jgi:hypothetical protein